MPDTLLADPAAKKWLRTEFRGMTGVDRENRAILGYVVAQEGAFLEPDPRGEFDEKALKKIVTLMQKSKAGTKVRLGHPTLSDDGISKFMGRAKNPRMDSVKVDGQTLLAVRADMYLAESSFETPNGNLGEYVLQRAEEDRDSFSSSLVLMAEEEWRLDSHKKRRLYEEGPNAGKEMPPLWRPTAIHASDIVDSGAAVSSFLSADMLASLPDAMLRQGCELLDAQFHGKDREFVKSHLSAFVDRYLSHRYGEVDDEPAQQPEATEEIVAPAAADEGLQLALYVMQEGG